VTQPDFRPEPASHSPVMPMAASDHDHHWLPIRGYRTPATIWTCPYAAFAV
jgi:hypothetical protein